MLETMRQRFLEHPERHPDVTWELVEQRLRDRPGTLEALARMEETGGKPDVIGIDPANGTFIICDCAKESPAGRRSLCYDDEALRRRKRNPPTGSAVAQAEAMGIELMDEELYYRLQVLGEFDTKTSSWILTPSDIRSRGGALFCEHRYGRTFTFHNGADSYYGVRGWRGVLHV